MREARRHRGAVPVLAVLGLSGIAAGSGVVVSASTTVPGGGGAGITSAPFGTVANPDSPSDGMDVELYTLTNAAGMEVKIMTYGGVIQSIQVPDRDGAMANVTLGFDNLDQYVNQSPYFGGITGTVRQPHRQGSVHPRRRDLPAGDQQ